MTPKKGREWRPIFLDVFAKTGNVTASATVAEISRKTVYERRKEDAEFASAWDEAEQASHDRLEQEAFRRAHDGVEDFKVGPNGQFVEMRRYSDTLLIFLLKARRPEKYREQTRIDVSGGLEVTSSDVTAAAERFTALADAAVRAFAGTGAGTRNGDSHG